MVLQSKVEAAITDYIEWQGQKLGRDINPSELIYKIIQAGAKRVEIIEPVFTQTTQRQLAKVETLEIKYGGLEDE